MSGVMKPQGGIRDVVALAFFGLVAACEGSSSPGDAGGPLEDALSPSDALAPVVDKTQIGNRVFADDEILSYYLTFSDEEYARLMDFTTLLVDAYHVNEERYVKAALRVGDTQLPTIGVRIKGDFSIWGCVDPTSGQRTVRVEPFFGDIDVCQRFSLKLDFDKYDSRLRLDGLKKLNLHAMSADPSKLRERLGYSLFRDMDIISPRAVHARLYINGEYQGLFAAVEQVDGRFTANRFPSSGDGNLYKELWPAAHVTGVAAEQALKTNDEPGVADVSDFLAFKDAIVASNDDGFATRMASFVDFDYLARYIVVDRAINNYDGIMAFYFGWGAPDYNHNYYWYHDTEGGLFVLIPWDLDKTFWYPEPNFWSDNAPNRENVVPNWNVTTKSCDGYTSHFDVLGGSYELREIDCDAFMRLLRGEVYARQKVVADAFIAGPFSEQSVTAKLNRWRAQIADAIEDDPLVDSARWQSSVDKLLASLPKLQGNVRLMMSGLIAE